MAIKDDPLLPLRERKVAADLPYPLLPRYTSTVAKEKLMSLTNELKRWARHELSLPYGTAEPDVQNEKVSLRQFLRKHAPDHYSEIFGGEAPVPERHPDEDLGQYERRMVMWQAAQDTKRTEYKESRRAHLRSAVLCAVVALMTAWGVGFASFLGFDHIGIVLPGIITGILLAIASLVLFCTYSGTKMNDVLGLS